MAHGNIADSKPAGGWHTASRLLLLLQVLGFAFMVAGTHGAFGPQPVPPTTTDFAGFYAAGLLADRGMPTAAYREAAHRAAEAEAVAPGVDEKPFLNPPVFLFVCAMLARLPYLAAFILFESVTFSVWLALAARIAGGGAPAALALACIPSVWWALGWGQNTFLSASLLSAGTLLVRQSPVLAGAAFGALCFKPHLALLVPVALIAGRHWRALASAAASVCAFSWLSVLCFGTAAWRACLAAIRAAAPIEIGTGLAGHVDLGSAMRLLGAPHAVQWTVQGAGAALSAICVAWLWRPRNPDQSCASCPARCDHGHACRANAGLIAGTLCASPFLLFYDLAIAGVAAAWLARAARHRDGTNALGWFAALACLDLFAFPAATLLHACIGALIPPCLLWLSVRRGPAARSSAF